MAAKGCKKFHDDWIKIVVANEWTDSDPNFVHFYFDLDRSQKLSQIEKKCIEEKLWGLL